jgi:hypothetical protein
MTKKFLCVFMTLMISSCSLRHGLDSLFDDEHSDVNYDKVASQKSDVSDERISNPIYVRSADAKSTFYLLIEHRMKDDLYLIHVRAKKNPYLYDAHNTPELKFMFDKTFVIRTEFISGPVTIAYHPESFSVEREYVFKVSYSDMMQMLDAGNVAISIDYAANDAAFGYIKSGSIGEAKRFIRNR